MSIFLDIILSCLVLYWSILLLFIDFDYLPPVTYSKTVPTKYIDNSIHSIQAPLVSFKNEKSMSSSFVLFLVDEIIDIGSYLYDDRSYDIFFPTDFSYIQYLYKQMFNKESNVFYSAWLLLLKCRSSRLHCSISRILLRIWRKQCLDSIH